MNISELAVLLEADLQNLTSAEVELHNAERRASRSASHWYTPPALMLLVGVSLLFWAALQVPSPINLTLALCGAMVILLAGTAFVSARRSFKYAPDALKYARADTNYCRAEVKQSKAAIAAANARVESPTSLTS